MNFFEKSPGQIDLRGWAWKPRPSFSEIVVFLTPQLFQKKELDNYFETKSGANRSEGCGHGALRDRVRGTGGGFG
jgi:hypothetical protein